jgi:Ser/Thr protein kinase RdoA (MazF antagonist)
VAEAFSRPFTRLSSDTIPEILREGWGITPDFWSAFGSERDDTLRVEAGGTSYVLKVSHPEDDPQRLHRVLDLMVFVGQHQLPFLTQTPIPTLTGELTFSVEGRLAHLLPFLDVTPIRHQPQGVSGVLSIGSAVWELQKATADFPSPYDTDHPWALGSLSTALSRLGNVEPIALKEACEMIMTTACDTTLTRLADLPSYPTHNDAHTDNVLVDDERVVGIADWGDSVSQPQIADLAVAASYARGYHPMWLAGGPWDAALTLREGYLAAGGPDDGDDLFRELVLARLAQRIVLNLAIAAAASDGGEYARRNMVNSVRDLRDLYTFRPSSVFPELPQEASW